MSKQIFTSTSDIRTQESDEMALRRGIARCCQLQVEDRGVCRRVPRQLEHKGRNVTGFTFFLSFFYSSVPHWSILFIQHV